MAEKDRKSMEKEGRVENPMIAEEFKVGICKGNPRDGLVLSFKGKRLSSKEEEGVAVIIPVDGMQEIIGGLFTLGVKYQKETGIDIGFSSVIKEEE